MGAFIIITDFGENRTIRNNKNGALTFAQTLAALTCRLGEDDAGQGVVHEQANYRGAPWRSGPLAIRGFGMLHATIYRRFGMLHATVYPKP